MSRLPAEKRRGRARPKLISELPGLSVLTQSRKGAKAQGGSGRLGSCPLPLRPGALAPLRWNVLPRSASQEKVLLARMEVLLLGGGTRKVYDLLDGGRVLAPRGIVPGGRKVRTPQGHALVKSQWG